MKMILVLIVPAVFGMVVLREPLIRLLFQRGAFDLEATRLTALAFLGYSPGIAFAAVDQLLIVAFYARKDTRTPVAVGVAALFVYLAVALSLIDALGMLGLVLANAAQTTFHAVVLLWLLSRQVRGVLDGQMATFLLKVIGASLFMALACQGALVWAAPLARDRPPDGSPGGWTGAAGDRGLRVWRGRSEGEGGGDALEFPVRPPGALAALRETGEALPIAPLPYLIVQYAQQNRSMLEPHVHGDFPRSVLPCCHGVIRTGRFAWRVLAQPIQSGFCYPPH